MATITIRNFDDELKSLLRLEAARHHRSMEEEVRVILRDALTKPTHDVPLGRRIQQRFAATPGDQIQPPSRKVGTRTVDFEK